MSVYRFKTNINCHMCVSRVKPVLEGTEDIRSWKVDLQDSDRTLEVESDEMPAEDIIRLVKKAGYTATIKMD